MDRAITVHRGRVLHFLDDPGERALPGSYEYFDEGAIAVRDGVVLGAGPARDVVSAAPARARIVDHGLRLLVPGFVDCHVHYAQTDMIASYGEQLLPWLEKYTFPTERRFADSAHARETAEFFIDELLRNGTTTAVVLGTVHRQSVDALFEAAQARRLRMVAGKVLMDRNCPADLCDTAESSYADSRALIERWHGRGRLLYALTPRFAPTSSDAQLALCGALAREFPDVFVHTHLAENRRECEWVGTLFPACRSYLDVYDRFGLVRRRSLFAHCLHVDGDDRRLLASRGAAAIFCPTANLFLGSGLFDLRAADAAGVGVAMGTDVGAGTTFSLLRTLHDAYNVAQLGHYPLAPLRAFYLATLAGARALGLDRCIGSFLPGCEADFVVLDLEATPLLGRRTRLAAGDLAEQLFALIMLGDDRSIAATYVAGEDRTPRRAA